VLLEAEGLLERHRGRPMTVANRPPTRSRRTDRLQQLTPHVDALVVAARQLEFSAAEVGEALAERWDKTRVGEDADE
jgi:GntR family transcriptional regulator